MEIKLSFPGNLKVDAHFGDFTVHTDQSKAAGGDGEYPDPFSYFMTGLAACAGFYVVKFCQARHIPTENIDIIMTNTWDKDKGLADSIAIRLELPAEFPEKYQQALVRAVNECSVKKTILYGPTMTVTSSLKTIE